MTIEERQLEVLRGLARRMRAESTYALSRANHGDGNTRELLLVAEVWEHLSQYVEERADLDQAKLEARRA